MSAFNRSYFDHNATTPVDRDLQAQIPGWLDSFGNPSSIHFDGRGPKQLIREARQNLAKLINCHPLEIVFTSGGSEANTLAILSAARANRAKSMKDQKPERTKILISAVEHPSVVKTSERLVFEGFEVLKIPVKRSGQIDLDILRQLLDQSVALVSVMFASNETGVIHPIAQIAEMAQVAGALVHCDGVQSIGKAPVDLQSLRVDYMSFSGHKFYGLKGSGFLFVRAQSPISSLIPGGGQERHRRAGTENTLGIAAMGFMAKKIINGAISLDAIASHRNFFEAYALKEIPGTEFIGSTQPRTPNTSALIIHGVSGESLLMNLDVNGFSVSTGAACSSGNPEPSPALLAMGFTFREAQSSLRVSFGKDSTRDEVVRFCECLKSVVGRLRQLDSELKSPEVESPLKVQTDHEPINDFSGSSVL